MTGTDRQVPMDASGRASRGGADLEWVCVQPKPMALVLSRSTSKGDAGGCGLSGHE
jgi:hypothetical protein